MKLIYIAAIENEQCLHQGVYIKVFTSSEGITMRYNREYSTMRSVGKTLCKDGLNKKLTGVCAGIAKHYDYPPFAVRVVAVAALIMLPVATGVAYIVASVLLPSCQHY